MTPADQDHVLATILRILNEANTADGVAITNLIQKRIPCNFALAEHVTIQVSPMPDGGDDAVEVGTLGVINGLVEALTGRRVMAVYDETGQFVVEFREWTNGGAV